MLPPTCERCHRHHTHAPGARIAALGALAAITLLLGPTGAGATGYLANYQSTRIDLATGARTVIPYVEPTSTARTETAPTCDPLLAVGIVPGTGLLTLYEGVGAASQTATATVPGDFETASMVASRWSMGDLLLLGIARSLGRNDVFVIDRTARRVLWSAAFTYGNAHCFRLGPARVAFVLGGTIRVFDAASGRVPFAPIALRPSGPPTAPALLRLTSASWLATAGDRVLAFDAGDGRVRWRRRLPRVVRGDAQLVAVVGGNALVVHVRSVVGGHRRSVMRIESYDGASGAPRRTVSIPLPFGVGRPVIRATDEGANVAVVTVEQFVSITP